MKRPWVIKAGGELLVSPSTRKKIFSHLIKSHRSRPIVFVHGGGPQIEEELIRQKIPNRFINGRRVTSSKAITVIEQVLSGRINKGIVGDLVASGVAAVGLSCRDGGTITAKSIPKLERAGTPVQVNTKLISALLAAGFMPIISTIGSDKKGGAININADDAASAIAVKLRAQNLIFLTNTAGVLDRKKKQMSRLQIAHIDKLIATSVISGGMIPKVQSARAAIRKGVGEVDILNGHKGVLLASGTRILK